MISACAELARKLVAGEAPDGGKKNGKVDGWFSVEKSKEKDKDGASSSTAGGKTLVVVGYVPSCIVIPSYRLMTST